jgi:hypothetical protein
MKSATLNEIKKQLQFLPPSDLVALCLRLGRFKKDNKELLTYLLFDVANESEYIAEIKVEMDLQFQTMNSETYHWAKKRVRKILRMVTKQIRYSGNPQTAVELTIYFCEKLKSSGLLDDESQALINLYQNQVKKVNAWIASMEEDLQYAYKKLLVPLKLEYF